MSRHHLFAGLMAILIIVYAILTLLAYQNPYFQTDLKVSQFVQMFRFPLADFAMVSLSSLGYYLAATVITLSSAVIVYLWRRQLRDVYFLLLSTGGALLIAGVFKLLVNRPRPPADLINIIGNSLTDPSFPSGHVLHFISLYGFLMYLIVVHSRTNWVRITAIAIFGFMIFGVGISRIYLGAHWFSDVVGSFLIGTAWLYFVIWLYRRGPNKV